jgi:hypothetical protein
LYDNAPKLSLLLDVGGSQEEYYLTSNGVSDSFFFEATNSIKDEKGKVSFSYELVGGDVFKLKDFTVETFKSSIIGFSGNISSVSVNALGTGEDGTGSNGDGTFHDLVARAHLLDSGVYGICKDLYLDGYDVYYFNQAQLSSGTSINTSQPYYHLYEKISAPDVNNYAIFGHSHGGGATYRLANASAAPSNAIFTIAGYIDAMKQQYGPPFAETRLIGAIDHFNIWQNNTNPSGVSINYASASNLHENGPSITHVNIDNVIYNNKKMYSKVRAYTSR